MGKAIGIVALVVIAVLLVFRLIWEVSYKIGGTTLTVEQGAYEQAKRQCQRLDGKFEGVGKDRRHSYVGGDWVDFRQEHQSQRIKTSLGYDWITYQSAVVLSYHLSHTTVAFIYLEPQDGVGWQYNRPFSGISGSERYAMNTSGVDAAHPPNRIIRTWLCKVEPR